MYNNLLYPSSKIKTIYKLSLSSLMMSELESVELHFDISHMCHTPLRQKGGEEDLSVAILPIHIYCVLFIFITVTTQKNYSFFVETFVNSSDTSQRTFAAASVVFKFLGRRGVVGRCPT
jgi:hypothetical protein